MDRRDQVATSDFTLAAVLLVRGFRLVATEPDPIDPRRRKRFVLSGDPSAFAELADQLLLDGVLVPARAFAIAQRRLKRLLYDDGSSSVERRQAQNGQAT